jgi:hypothetical protein
MQAIHGAASFELLNKRTIRSTPNPLDRCTVVSIYPREINEIKWTTQPSTYTIPPGTKESPAILVVEPSSWWREFDVDQPLIEVVNSSIQVADSIIKDWSQGILGCDMGDKMPGLFYLLGDVKVEEVKTKHKAELDKAERKQRNWYALLVKIGDSFWSRSQGNPMQVPDLCRLAATELGQGDKPWLKDSTLVSLVKCVACGQLRNPEFPLCPHCKNVVDQELAKKLNLKFA